jgi:hypothetical protein
LIDSITVDEFRQGILCCITLCYGIVLVKRPHGGSDVDELVMGEYLRKEVVLRIINRAKKLRSMIKNSAITSACGHATADATALFDAVYAQRGSVLIQMVCRGEPTNPCTNDDNLHDVPLA